MWNDLGELRIFWFFIASEKIYSLHVRLQQFKFFLCEIWKRERRGVSVKWADRRGPGDSGYVLVFLKCFSVMWSTGKKLMVALYSGHMLAMVVRSGADNWDTPGPKNSTNLPEIPAWRSCWKNGSDEEEAAFSQVTSDKEFIQLNGTVSDTFVMPRTMSIEVARGLMEPTSLQPTTWGRVSDTGCPSITASDSIPPTPEEKPKDFWLFPKTAKVWVAQRVN